MTYSIEGGNLPILRLSLEAGESIECEAGSMSWMDEGIEMQTQGGGLGKMFGRMLTNESAFSNIFTAHSAGEIVMASKFPGSIKAVHITPGSGLIVQKGSFLASAGKVTSEVFVNEKIKTGLFSGEGFLMRRFSGSGIVFLEVDGSAFEYELAAGECKIINTGYLASMTESCKMEVRTVKGAKNIFFGGEGLFNTVVYGPGKITLQSMPIAATAMRLYAYMPHPSNN